MRSIMFAVGVVCFVWLLMEELSITRGKPAPRTFEQLVEDPKMSADEKWVAFLMNREAWGMCSPSEQVKDMDGVLTCEYTPTEFYEMEDDDVGTK